MPDYAKKTVVELTEILKSRSLPHTGKKADLVARLNEADKAAQAQQAAPEPPPAIQPAAGPPPAKAEPQPAKSPVNVPKVSPVKESAASDPPQPAATTRAVSEGTDAKLAAAVNYSMGLDASLMDEEMKKRKARAERFGTGNTDKTATAPDAEAMKALERAKRFGTGGGGFSKLDEALPMERERRGKRGLEQDSYDDPGLRSGRGGRRFRGRGHGRGGPRGGRPEGVKKTSGAAVSDNDRLAAEARKKRFGTTT